MSSALRAVLTATQNARSLSMNLQGLPHGLREVQRDVGVQLATIIQADAAVHNVPVAAAFGTMKRPL